MSKESVKKYLPTIPDADDPFCVLTPRFMNGCSKFKNFASFIENSPWTILEGDIITDDGDPVPVDEMDEYVRENSRFQAWPELIDAAEECWDADISPAERARQRQSCNVSPIFIEQSYNEGEGTLVDISVRGAGIETSIPMPVGGWVKVTLPGEQTADVDPLPERTIQFRGLIRWSEQTGGKTRAGVELTARLL